MLVISKQRRQSLGIKISTIRTRIDNWVVLADALVVLDVLAVLDASAVLAVLTALTALTVLDALTALVVLVAHLAPDVAAGEVNRLVFPLRKSPVLLQGTFNIG